MSCGENGCGVGRKSQSRLAGTAVERDWSSMWRVGMTRRPRIWTEQSRLVDHHCSSRAACCDAAVSRGTRGHHLSTSPRHGHLEYRCYTLDVHVPDHAGAAYSIRETTMAWKMCRDVAGVPHPCVKHAATRRQQFGNVRRRPSTCRS